jgi:RNA polymerase sigma factor (sigma-70 family)
LSWNHLAISIHSSAPCESSSFLSRRAEEACERADNDDGSSRSCPLAVDGSDGVADGNANATAEQVREDHDLEAWCQFHEAVDKLPAAEREVIGLAFYHGWKQTDIAALLQVTERTVRRNWQSACLRLRELIGDKLPRP